MAKKNMTLRIDPDLKEQAADLFKALGLDLSTATGMFYRQALRCHGLPFEVKLDEPNETTYAAMDESEHITNDPETEKYSDVDDLFANLDL